MEEQAGAGTRRVTSPFDQSRVEVPGRVAEPGQHHQPDEQRDAAQHGKAATIRPHSTGPGLRAAARKEVAIAAPTWTGLSTSIGKVTMLDASATIAKPSPTRLPIDQPPALAGGEHRRPGSRRRSGPGSSRRPSGRAATRSPPSRRTAGPAPASPSAIPSPPARATDRKVRPARFQPCSRRLASS